MRRVVVTGLGAVTPLGVGIRRTWSRLVDGECGITSLRGRGIDLQGLQSQVAGIVPEGVKEDGGWDAREWISRDDQRKMAKFMQFGFAAAQEALEDADWPPTEPFGSQLAAQARDDTGVCLGTGIGAFEDICETNLAHTADGPRTVSPYFVPRLLANLGAGHIAMHYKFRGPNHAVSTACTTGAHSIGDAFNFIRLGQAKVMVAGGAESCIHPLAFVGFQRSKSLTTSSNEDPERASRPFSRDRDGFVISEGAAVLVLEDYAHAIERGAKIYAELAGYGLSADAHHLTQPSPDGSGACLAMQRAVHELRDSTGLVGEAVLEPSNRVRINYINAHGTSTKIGDAAEVNAIEGLGRICNLERTLTSSTKGATGHLLGAAGALEACFTVLAVGKGIVPPTINLTDSEFGRLDLVPLKARQHDISVALTNSFGFGGTNASLCFKRISSPEYSYNRTAIRQF